MSIDPKKIAEWKALVGEPDELSAEWARGIYEREIEAVTAGAAPPWGNGEGPVAEAKAAVDEALLRARERITKAADAAHDRLDSLRWHGEGAIRALLAEREEMLALLREVEWEAGTALDDGCGVMDLISARGSCPACHATESEGHAPDCRLSRAIREET